MDLEELLFDPYADLSVHARNLPHWRQEGRLYFVTWRQADSLPAEKRDALRRDREAFIQAHGDPATTYLPIELQRRYHELFSERVQRWLDAGSGSCVLRDQRACHIMRDALLHFEGVRYQLGSFAIAANHVHVLVAPVVGIELPQVLHSWKSYTAKATGLPAGRSTRCLVAGERCGRMKASTTWCAPKPHCTISRTTSTLTQIRRLTCIANASHKVAQASCLCKYEHRRDACATLCSKPSRSRRRSATPPTCSLPFMLKLIMNEAQATVLLREDYRVLISLSKFPVARLKTQLKHWMHEATDARPIPFVFMDHGSGLTGALRTEPRPTGWQFTGILERGRHKELLSLQAVFDLIRNA